MGILRVITTKRYIKLSAALFVLATALFVNVFPVSKVSALAPSAPYLWKDSQHSYAFDGSGNSYGPIGHACINNASQVGGPIISTDANGLITVSTFAKVGKNITSVSKASIPGCSDGTAAQYIWALVDTSTGTQSSNQAKYALIVQPSLSKPVDPKTCNVVASPVKSSTDCSASVYNLGSDGTISSAGFVESVGTMVVSTTGLPPVKTPLVVGGQKAPSCESSGFSLSWIACPIVESLAKAVDGIYGTFLQPLLVTKPISLDTKCTGQSIAPQECNPNFRTWSGFRVYGDVFLVIALLVVVFGQSIGGGLIDAYSAKKILPRLLMAAVLINLSYYIVAFAVDVTNVVGQGIQTLLTQPFVNANAFHISMNAGSQIAVTGVGLGLFAGVTALFAGTLVGGAIVVSALIEILPLLLLFVIFPALLLFLSILFTLILRQGIIILLLVVSPIAFALYCLPNTEKYFKKWWDTLFRTLLVYPIIAVLFSLGNILSVILERTSQSNSGLNTLAQLMSFIGLIIPLFLIPFAFKMSGGVLGKFQEAANSLGKRGLQAYKGNPNDTNSRQSRARFRAGDRSTALREKAVAAGKATGSSRSKKLFGRAMNYGNLQATRSGYNRAGSERVQTQLQTGDDGSIRDAYIAWDSDANEGKGGWFRRMDMESGHAVPGSSSVYSDYSTGFYAKKKALTLANGSKSLVQDGIYYEWKKTSFDPDKLDRLQKQYSEILSDNSLTESEGAEIMNGVGYRHSGQSLALKYGKFKKDTAGDWGWKTDYFGMANEASLNIDTYSASRLDVKTYKAFTQGYLNASKQLGDNNDYSNDNTVIVDDTNGLKGKTKAEVYKMKQNLAEIASKHNPQQVAGSARIVSESKDEDQPQMSSQGGIGNAPVQVQAAASQFYETVFGPRPMPGNVQPEEPNKSHLNGELDDSH